MVQKQQILIQKTLEVLSLLRPIVHDTPKTAKITWFILVLVALYATRPGWPMGFLAVGLSRGQRACWSASLADTDAE